MRRRLLSLALAALTCGACESVPDIDFVDAGAPRTDASNDASKDASTDGATDADETGGVCPAAPPAGANACCNDVPCSGTCGTGDCNKCVGQCAAVGLVCCSDRRPISCVPLGQPCQ